MSSITHAAGVVLVAVLGVQAAHAQTPFKYREHTLASSLAAVIRTTEARETDAKLLHERPAMIQQLEWRTPYSSGANGAVDPVRTVLFSFYNDQLYEIVVTYDRDRVEGMTNDDMIAALSSTYGPPLAKPARTVRSTLPVVIPPSVTVVAQWEDAGSWLSLSRNRYSPELQLVLISKALQPRAVAAISEAARLDAREAPERQRKARASAEEAARTASDAAREANKAAFQP